MHAVLSGNDWCFWSRAEGCEQAACVRACVRARSCVATPRSATSKVHPGFIFLCSACFSKIKQAQDEERRQLIQLRDILKSALQVEQKEVRGFKIEGSQFSPPPPPTATANALEVWG